MTSIYNEVVEEIANNNHINFMLLKNAKHALSNGDGCDARRKKKCLSLRNR